MVFFSLMSMGPCRLTRCKPKQLHVGGIITSYNSEFENLDGQGHGVKLEQADMTVSILTSCGVFWEQHTDVATDYTQPYAILSFIPWRGGLDFKRAALGYRHLAGYISVARDRDSGRVYADATTGAPCVEYTPSAFDRAHMLQGILALSRIAYVTGARTIDSFVQGVAPFVRDGDADADMDSDPAFAAWLAEVQRVGAVAGKMPANSAHQMGSCRMAVREADGVVSPRGKVWGTEGLYVADASVFPSASGVNPMITVMAIADWIARGVDRDLMNKM